MQKEYQTLFKMVDDLYQLFPDKQSISPDEIKSYIGYKMPKARDLDFLEGIVDSAFETDVGAEVSEIMMQQLAEIHIAGKIVSQLMPVIERTSYERVPEVVELAAEYNELAGALTADHSLMPCTDSLMDLAKAKSIKTGLGFPVKKIHDALGDIEYGSSGLIFARPETGKTSLGVNIAAHWASAKRNEEDWLGLYFGVEEKIQKHRMRYAQALLGCKEHHILDRPEPAHKEALKRGLDKFMFFGSVATTRDIEQLVKQYNPKAIIIDQTPKIYKPGQPDSEVQRLAQIFLWVRMFAKEKLLATINLMQAAASAENKQWLLQTDMHNSKTDVAGETDWALGIGLINEPGMEYTRFLSLCRNKNGPHCRTQAYFDFDRCLYQDRPPQQKGKP
jgi:hypothetical protein